MRVFITAPSGVGKTTVTHELARQGFAAYDTDDVPGMARLELQETGEPAEWPDSGFVDWKKYAWNIQQDVFSKLLAENETIFLSGICGNQDKFYNKFDKLIALTLQPEEYLRRMRTREYRGANDDEINIQQRLVKYPILLQRFLDSGFVTIDNSGTPEHTANKILEMINAD